MKLVFKLALGIIAAIGGFLDINDLVFNTQAGATFGYSLLQDWTGIASGFVPSLASGPFA